jgi:hypothetical protein
MADETAAAGDAAGENETVAGVDDTIQTSGFQAPTLDDIPASVGPVALREAAAEGDPKALFVIGDRLMGDGPERARTATWQAAARWYEMAAEMGFAPAQYRIGNAYEKGFGVERDLKAAMTWYQLAAEQGNVSAMHNLAVLYATEIDGHRDMPEAARWFLEAAERGVKDSQVNLGILAARGEGVPRTSPNPTNGWRSPPSPATRMPRPSATRSPNSCARTARTGKGRRRTVEAASAGPGRQWRRDAGSLEGQQGDDGLHSAAPQKPKST